MTGIEPAHTRATTWRLDHLATPTIEKLRRCQSGENRTHPSPARTGRATTTLHSGAETRDRTELGGFSDRCNDHTCSLRVAVPDTYVCASGPGARTPCGDRTRLTSLKGSLPHQKHNGAW